MKKLDSIALTAIALLLLGCGQSTEDTLPPSVKSFVDSHPELNLQLRELEAVSDWAQGKRWRAKSAVGQTLIIYEKGGTIESIRLGGAFLWDRQGRHRQ